MLLIRRFHGYGDWNELIDFGLFWVAGYTQFLAYPFRLRGPDRGEFGDAPLLCDFLYLVPSGLLDFLVTARANRNHPWSILMMKMIQEHGSTVLGSSQSIELEVSKLGEFQERPASVRNSG